MKLLQILIEKYRDQYELNLKESLTKTYEINQSIKSIARTLESKGLKNNHDYKIDKDGNSFELVMLDPNKIDFENDVVKLANNLGWFPSFLTVRNGYSGKWDPKQIPNPIDPRSGIQVRFEAKYDEQSGFKVPKLMYHVTTNQKYEKIKRIGLVPKSDSKKSVHPERIYLAADLESAKDILEMFQYMTNKPQSEYAILQINTDSIPGDYFRIYKDPNYEDRGYYTMNNIPPYAIEKVKDIEL